MLITREVDYALRMLRDLSDGEQKAVGILCQRELVPQQFAYKILKKLSNSGFVSISRGVEGGCRLIADLSEKSLYDLMYALGAIEPINACLNPDYQCAWKQSYGKPCKIHNQLDVIQEALGKELRAHSLASLILGKDEIKAE